ncbi:MAG: glycosyltransferase, partial [Candidatus Jordarchaeaceae archaeon]
MSKIPREDKERELSIVIPTYNESENIGPLISEIEKVFRNYGIDGEILVVDDNSPDGTADVVRKYMEMFDNV